MAVGRHAEPRAQQNAAVLLRWLYAHPQANPIVKDGFLRAIERLGDAGVEEDERAARPLHREHLRQRTGHALAEAAVLAAPRKPVYGHWRVMSPFSYLRGPMTR